MGLDGCKVRPYEYVPSGHFFYHGQIHTFNGIEILQARSNHWRLWKKRMLHPLRNKQCVLCAIASRNIKKQLKQIDLHDLPVFSAMHFCYFLYVAFQGRSPAPFDAFCETLRCVSPGETLRQEVALDLVPLKDDPIHLNPMNHPLISPSNGWKMGGKWVTLSVQFLTAIEAMAHLQMVDLPNQMVIFHSNLSQQFTRGQFFADIACAAQVFCSTFSNMFHLTMMIRFDNQRWLKTTIPSRQTNLDVQQQAKYRPVD